MRYCHSFNKCQVFSYFWRSQGASFVQRRDVCIKFCFYFVSKVLFSTYHLTSSVFRAAGTSILSSKCTGESFQNLLTSRKMSSHYLTKLTKMSYCNFYQATLLSFNPEWHLYLSGGQTYIQGRHIFKAGDCSGRAFIPGFTGPNHWTPVGQ